MARQPMHLVPSSPLPAAPLITPGMLDARDAEAAAADARRALAAVLARPVKKHQNPSERAAEVRRACEWLATLPTVDQKFYTKGLAQHYDLKVSDINEELARVRALTPPAEDTSEGVVPDWAVAALTDTGNGERFARLHADEARHCWATKQWFVWGGTYWVPDQGDHVQALAKDVARSIYHEAAGETTDDERKALASWAMKSESEKLLNSMISLARSEPAITITTTELDPDPHLLNTPSGTVDLRTGTLYPHRREDMISMITAAPYAPGTTHPMLDKFLARAFPDAALRRYVQKWAGYSLTGEITEDTFAFAWGETKGGKTTFVEALQKTLGEGYAATAEIATFAQGRPKAGAARDDVFRLRGKRLVISSEVPKDMQLDVANIKQWTGGDTIAARTLYAKTVQFPPTMKITIACNDLPEAPDEEPALWERIVVIPFPPTIPVEERDPQIKATLKSPALGGPAVLAWMIEGAILWYREGLGKKPEAVVQATRQYQLAMNPLAGFVADWCALDGSTWTASADLWQGYTAWCRLNGKSRTAGFMELPELSRRAFGLAAGRLEGVTPEEQGHQKTRGFRGIALKPGSTPPTAVLPGGVA
ncbi:MAG TPA: phage/plasmid primase, P4 family [Candidatus Acidoferrum sp.]|nr:phage/plasmid primase, P4 family [Candidatus Acidoferrum sp.]